MKKTTLLLFLLIGILSCKNDENQEQDINKIPMELKIERFDQLFGQATTDNLPKLQKTYPFMFSKKYSDSFWLAKTEDTLQIQWSVKV